MSASDRHLNDLERVVATRGWALQAVLATYPGDVDFTYTVGNTAVGLPELLLVGAHPQDGEELLDALTVRLRAGTVQPVAGTVVPFRLMGFDAGWSLRLAAVAERWAVHYGVMAYGVHLSAGGHPRDVRFLQVILPDPCGRFRDEPGYDRLDVDRWQPDLSDPHRPWRVPYVPPVDLVEPPPGDVVVVVPVREPHDGHTGRHEAVPAVGLGEDVFRLIRPPILADWVTVGTEVHASRGQPLPLPGAPESWILREERRSSALVHLVWLLHAHDELEHVALMRRIAAELDLPDTVWVDTPGSVHVATPPRFAQRLRSRMRHLERDGLAVEREPYHRPVEPDLACGPWCAWYEGP